MKQLTLLLLAALSMLLGSCSDDDGNKGTCDPLSPDCAAGLSCEVHPDGESRCVSPLLVRGSVLDIIDDGPIEGALVQAVDVNGAALGTSATSDSNGDYELQIPVPRAEDGSPLQTAFTLRAQAAEYEAFPSALRQALPLDAGSAADLPEGFVLDDATTAIKLLPLPGDTSQLGSISGAILSERNAGVLVVAEAAGTAKTGYSDGDGAYTIFNVPAGSYTVKGYAAGVSLDAAQADLASGEHLSGVDLGPGSTPLASVTGRVQIVNAPGGSVTSVVLAIESTFIENAARGEVPPGLRAPAPGTEPNIDSAFTIADVPAGRYVVLAAFENDGLVRDPDPSISGTQILHIEVAGTDLDISAGFKITEALEVISPGAAGLETVSSQNPVFQWADDSGETGFEVIVYDAFGNEIWLEPSVDKYTGAGNPELEYTGPALEEGMIYQFRATSYDADGPLSQTEDLKGVFSYQPE